MLTHNGHDWSGRYPWIVESALKNRTSQFVVDGEAGRGERAPREVQLVDRQKMMTGLLMLVDQDIIFRTLIGLHHLKGKDGDKWLSEFEAQLIRDVKDLVPEGIGMEDETAGYETAIAHIQYLFDGARRKIVKKTEGE